MADLNLDLDYFGHPKTKRLIGLLGRGAEVLPIKLWCYCGKYHAEDGRLTGYAAQEIEAIVDWWGPRGECLTAMVQVGFMEFDGDTYCVHGWSERAGHIAALRAAGQKAARSRWDRMRSHSDRNADGNAIALRPQCSYQPTNLPTNLPTSGGGSATPQEDATSARLADAGRHARNWLTANYACHLKPAIVAAFERAILQLGRAGAEALFVEVASDPGVEHLGAVLDTRLKRMAAGRGAPATGPRKTIKYS